MPTPPALYSLISTPWLRRVLGRDDPARDVRWIDPEAQQFDDPAAGLAEAARVLRRAGSWCCSCGT